MQKRNDGNSLQTLEEALSDTDRQRDYSYNRELIAVAQSGISADADKASAELVKINTGLVRSIAVRFRDRGVDFEDLMQIGTLGLLKAIRSFDLDRGTCFSTYAVPLIFGELRRHMRDEGPIKVGRYYKKLGASLVNTKNRIVAEEGRDPAISELAILHGISAEEAAIALDAMSPIVSLSDNVYGEDDDTELFAVIPDEDSSSEIDRLCDKIALRQAMSRMPEMWQKIIILRFYRNMTQQQTATQLGITQVKVSREEKKIMESFRKYFS